MISSFLFFFFFVQCCFTKKCLHHLFMRYITNYPAYHELLLSTFMNLTAKNKNRSYTIIFLISARWDYKRWHLSGAASRFDRSRSSVIPFTSPSLDILWESLRLHNFPRALANIRKIATLAQPAGVMGVLGRAGTLKNPRPSKVELVKSCVFVWK